MSQNTLLVFSVLSLNRLSQRYVCMFLVGISHDICVNVIFMGLLRTSVNPCGFKPQRSAAGKRRSHSGGETTAPFVGGLALLLSPYIVDTLVSSTHICRQRKNNPLCRDQCQFVTATCTSGKVVFTLNRKKTFWLYWQGVGCSKTTRMATRRGLTYRKSRKRWCVEAIDSRWGQRLRQGKRYLSQNWLSGLYFQGVGCSESPRKPRHIDCARYTTKGWAECTRYIAWVYAPRHRAHKNETTQHQVKGETFNNLWNFASIGRMS